MILVYTTCKNQREANKISQHLLKKRLCACTNFFKIHSHYWWKGRIASSSEYGLFIKTKDELFSNVQKEIRSVHSYDLPLIVMIQADADTKVLRWINQSVGKV